MRVLATCRHSDARLALERTHSVRAHFDILTIALDDTVDVYDLGLVTLDGFAQGRQRRDGGRRAAFATFGTAVQSREANLLINCRANL